MMSSRLALAQRAQGVALASRKAKETSRNRWAPCPRTWMTICRTECEGGNFAEAKICLDNLKRLRTVVHRPTLSAKLIN
jgi:hypothetical protein